MSPATKALLTAFADALRRERSAREAVADATREAREAARLQADLLSELGTAGVSTNAATRMAYAALGEPLEVKARSRVAARLRKRRQRLRSLVNNSGSGPGLGPEAA